MLCYESAFAVAVDGTTAGLAEAKRLSHDTVINNAGEARRSGVRWTIWPTTTAQLELAAQGITLPPEAVDLCRVYPHRTLVMATVEVEA